MSEQNQPERPHPKKRNTEPLKPVLLVFAFILVLIAGAAVYYLNRTDGTGEQVQTAPPVTGEHIPPIMEETKDTEVIEQLLTTEKSPLPVIEALPPEAETAAAPIQTPEEKRAKECRILAEQINGFFTHIDNREYIKSFELQSPSQDYFIALAYKLLKNPPVVSRESDDLYTILKNMAHFFRVIGKDNIILIKTILDRERDKIEDVAAEIYQWTAWNSCNDELLQFSPSLADMYEYAGFFLNTMGGRSYLFRRDSRSRLLVNYYSVLIIERANAKGLNRHGIDISQIIPQLVQEIDSSNQLIYKENYIDSLYNLLEKYQ